MFARLWWTHIDKLLKSKYTAKDIGSLGFEDKDVKSSVVEPCCNQAHNKRTSSLEKELFEAKV